MKLILPVICVWLEYGYHLIPDNLVFFWANHANIVNLKLFKDLCLMYKM